ncbi:MAG: outer membrane lipoprotein-sorting protein [Verrucomicrobiota bacterium]
MKYTRLWMVLLLALFSISNSFSQNAKEHLAPPIDYVLARLWRNLQLQDFKLEGYVRTEKKKYPIVLRTKAREMIYEFQDQPIQIRVVLNPDQSVVEKRANSGSPWKAVTGKDRLQKILDTDMTYEDLGMEFLRWDNVKSLGNDSIKTLPTWVYEAEPNQPSSYSKARYWISTQYYAFMQVDAYNSKGQVVKRVEVNGIQKIGVAYVIQEMQISTMIPGRDLSSSRTWIDIRNGEPGKSGI